MPAMQPGLFYLWMLSAALGAAAWLYLEMAAARHKGFQTRIQLTGCELARQVLDRNDQPQAAVLVLRGERRIHFGLGHIPLALAEPVYHGTRLTDLAIALHQTAHFLNGTPSVFPASLRARKGPAVGLAITISWFLVGGGALFPAWGWMSFWGQLVLVLLCLGALGALAEEWEVTDRATNYLAFLNELGVDERVRVKALLKAYRWVTVAELFGEPLSLLFQNRKGVSVRVP